MPARDRVEAMVALVEAARFVEALEAFYHYDASMQENNDPPRKGRAILIAGEHDLLARFGSIATLPNSTFVLDGDQVVIRWTFVFTWPDGSSFNFEELAQQTWRGDRIAVERFFYDPQQRRPPADADRVEHRTPSRDRLGPASQAPTPPPSSRG
jgi:hypothetical protein